MTTESSSRASAASIQSFDTIRQDSSSLAPNAHLSDDDQRWSEVVPPNSALTFDLDSRLSFSDPELFSEPFLAQRHTPSDMSISDDDRSQVLTISQSLFPTSENTGTLQYFHQTHDSFFPTESTERFPTRSIRGRTQTSSTMDGLDVYLRGSLMGKAHNANRYRSCFEGLEGEFALDPRTSFANAWLQYMKHGARPGQVHDEGFFESEGQDSSEDGEDNLPSRFSVTTTSTSNYILVDDDENEKPACSSPEEVLRRPQYNFSYSDPMPPPPPPPPEASLRSRSTPGSPRARNISLSKFTRGISFSKSSSKLKAEAAGPGWVWIDVKDNLHGRSASES